MASAGFTTTTPATRSGWSAARRSISAPPIERPATTTASFSASSFSNTRDASPYQSLHAVLFMSCQVVPWPGRRGTSTAYPRSARNSPHGFIEAGEPVKPWLSSTPTRRPPVSSGRAATDRGEARGWIGHGRILHQGMVRRGRYEGLGFRRRVGWS